MEPAAPRAAGQAWARFAPGSRPPGGAHSLLAHRDRDGTPHHARGRLQHRKHNAVTNTAPGTRRQGPSLTGGGSRAQTCATRPAGDGHVGRLSLVTARSPSTDAMEGPGMSIRGNEQVSVNRQMCEDKWERQGPEEHRTTPLAGWAPLRPEPRSLLLGDDRDLETASPTEGGPATPTEPA